ncbi:MAG: hypothetical protein ABSC31_13690 [Acidimicrobiales bacterium]|jgi:uncharacterized protein (DUF983 family)
MKALRDIGSGVLVTALWIALVTVWPLWAALLVVTPYVALLALAQIGEWREGHV